VRLLADGRAVKRRRRRLTAAGAIWVLVLWLSLGFASTRGRGRLPDLPDATPQSRLDSALSEIASELSGVGADVYCWSKADWEDRTSLGAWRAYAGGYPRSINLSPEVCGGLTSLFEDHLPVWEAASPDALAWSIAALAHESIHMRGIHDEGVAECHGVQSIRTAAGLLGRTPAEGRYLTQRYWKRFYRWSRPPYRSGECRNGGRLDLRPGTDVFP
jgi:hypothetical protein